MSTDAITVVGAAVEAFCTSLFKPAPGGAQLLGLQPGGLPIGQFAGNAVAAAAALDSLTDATASIVGGQYQPTLISASSLFDLILVGATAASGSQASLVGKLLNGDREVFYGGGNDTLAAPADFWDARAAGNWATTSFSSGAKTAPPTSGAGARWGWRILPPAHQMVVTSGLSAQSSFSSGAAVTPRALTPRQTARRVTFLNTAAAASPVQASNLSVSFDYCAVTLHRSWWDQLLITNQGWYLPSYGAGSLASGDRAGGIGLCPTIPVGMVLVRDVKIAGSWTDQEKAALPLASSLGPISLLGRTLGTNLSVTVPGIQIVAWVVQVLPALPPLGDPSPAPTASEVDPLAALPQLVSGAQGPTVRRAQGLLRAAIPTATDASLPIGGKLDAATLAALATFQKQNGLGESGQIDTATWRHLLGI